MSRMHRTKMLSAGVPTDKTPPAQGSGSPRASESGRLDTAIRARERLGDTTLRAREDLARAVAIILRAWATLHLPVDAAVRAGPGHLAFLIAAADGAGDTGRRGRHAAVRSGPDAAVLLADVVDARLARHGLLDAAVGAGPELL